ncbi:MAG TPA: L-seryl-tRNA(Sec) selenium transferase [Candidatus Limnocylindria bacterium]|nr:L-seryl-tRNA(Sec) selenium transferase [Candidatus Limnocylindria bacterium]
MTDPRRRVPSVDAVLRASPADAADRRRLTAAVRDVLTEARTDARSAGGEILEPAAYAKLARDRIARRDAPTLRRVINATGVVLHTNLGRAPLSQAALAAIRDASGPVSVEYDLERGTRGERHSHAARLIAEVTGAEDAVVVNNGAAAVLLALAALAGKREVIVARGELVEIGGGFRIPDVLTRSGAKLVEVGTTNRTYVRDYANAISDKTGAILRVHASNFALRGFVAKAASPDLAKLARERGVAFIHDLGSGTLLDTARFGLGREETVQEAVRDGADVVTFSGDKLLGGPQAGIAAGRAEAIAKLRTHPLMRALRPDKLTIAALVATVAAYRDGTALETLPVWRLIAETPARLAKRAKALVARLEAAGIPASVVETSSTVGGGSLPEETQPSHGVALAATSAARAVGALRSADPPVIARILDDRVVLDLRSVLPEQDEQLVTAVVRALARP